MLLVGQKRENINVFPFMGDRVNDTTYEMRSSENFTVVTLKIVCFVDVRATCDNCVCASVVSAGGNSNTPCCVFMA